MRHLLLLLALLAAPIVAGPTAVGHAAPAPQAPPCVPGAFTLYGLAGVYVGPDTRVTIMPCGWIGVDSPNAGYFSQTVVAYYPYRQNADGSITAILLDGAGDPILVLKPAPNAASSHLVSVRVKPGRSPLETAPDAFLFGSMNVTVTRVAWY